MNITLEQEILDVLAMTNGVTWTGYLISVAIEDRRERENRPTRFLFWKFYAVGLGSLYRALDKLVSNGQVLRIRTEHHDGTPPRFEYRLP